MRFVSTIWTKKLYGTLLLSAALASWNASAQENSPYSRFGLGNVVPSQNVLNRAMGGVSAAYSDVQSINFVNPASYSKLRVTTFDVGLDFENRTLRVPNQTNSFRAKNMLVNYVQIGVPLNKKNWGLNFGLRPITRINYKINDNTRLPSGDSIQYQYEGSGGSYQAFAGTGRSFGNFSFGINTGYFFGRQEYQTRAIPLNDTVIFTPAKVVSNTNFGNAFISGGIQYAIAINKTDKKKSWLRFGAYGTFSNTLNASRSVAQTTFTNSPELGDITVDTISNLIDQSGSILYPAQFGGGILYEKVDKLMIGVDFEQTNWSQYRYYGNADQLRDSWLIRFGAQVLPNQFSKKYWGRVNYRAGFYTGPDQVSPNGANLPQFGFTFGMGFPIPRGPYSTQFTVIHTNFEIGSRGNRDNTLRESIFRVSLGLSLSDIWFRPRQYN